MADLYSDIPELSAQQTAIARRRKIAEMIQAQSMKPLESQQVPGGYVVPTSPLLGIGKVLEAYMGRKASDEADTAQLELGQKAQGMESAERQKVADAVLAQQEQTRPDENMAGPMPGTAPTLDAQQERLISLNPIFDSAQKERELRLKVIDAARTREDTQANAKLLRESTQKSGTEDVFINGKWQKVKVGPKGEVLVNEKIGDPFARGKDASSVTVDAGGSKKYSEELAKDQIENIRKLEKDSTAAYESNIALDELIKNSDNASEGQLATVVSMGKNLMASFGLDSDSLTSDVLVRQAIGKNKASYMQALGARGLTDKDMEILGDALPNFGTSSEARKTVAEIVKKSNKRVIDEYSNALSEEQRTRPEEAKYRVKPKWLNTYNINNAYVETRKTKDGRTLGRKADGTIEEVK